MAIEETTFRLVVQRAQGRDPEAFAELYSSYASWLSDFIRLRFEIDVTEDVEDLALETWEGVWREIPNVPSFLIFNEQSFLRWLRKMATVGALAFRQRQVQEAEIKDFFLNRSKLLQRSNGIWIRASALLNSGLMPLPEPAAEFTVYHPRVVVPNTWFRVLFYAHRSSALDDVQADSEARLVLPVDAEIAGAQLTSENVGAGPDLRIVPDVQGFDLRPAEARFHWSQDWHCAEFYFRAYFDECLPGYMNVYVGPVLVAKITLAIRSANSSEQRHLPRTRTSGSPYQSVFASHSSADARIVDQLEKAYLAIGFQFLRDMRILRSGEKWGPALREAIQSADVFQLFWSHNASKSDNVREEWKYAVLLNRPQFIRPVYWETPMPAPPAELRELHFHRLDL